MSTELLVDAKARLGECPLWCERTGRLYWTDIEGAAISAWTAADGNVRCWALPERVGSFALCEQPSLLLLGLASGVALYDLEREAITPIVRVEAEQPTTRINDGRTDRSGNFDVWSAWSRRYVEGHKLADGRFVVRAYEMAANTPARTQLSQM